MYIHMKKTHLIDRIQGVKKCHMLDLIQKKLFRAKKWKDFEESFHLNENT